LSALVAERQARRWQAAANGISFVNYPKHLVLAGFASPATAGASGINETPARETLTEVLRLD
jgi:hypothetical protein